MSFSQRLKAFTYALIAVGFAALASTGVIGAIPLLLFPAVLVGSWFLDTAAIRRAITKWGVLGPMLTGILIAVIDWLLWSQSPAIALVHLTIYVSALKLVTLSTDSDRLQLYLISSTELIAAAMTSANILLSASFCGFLFAGIGVLILLEMRRSNLRIQRETRVQPFIPAREGQGTELELFSPFPGRLFTAMLVGLTLLIIAVAMPIFLFLPRVSGRGHPVPKGETQFISGFSERVELGQIGSINKSSAVVMRVKTDRSPEELPADIKWRGIAFDRYEGHSWSQSQTARSDVPRQGGYYKLENSTQGADWIRQTFFIEALSTDLVFAAHKPLAVSRDVGSLQEDLLGNLHTDGHPSTKVRYSVISDPIRPDPANMSDLRPIPSEILERYARVTLSDPRIAQLVRAVTREADGRYEKAQAIERHLRNHYRYSLTLRGAPGNLDPISVFLFDVRAGHCEYFASAMTIMLRQIGIPARLVNGFRRGEYNSLGDSWTVRQRDAHSWVEAYLPPYEWVEFDPTPPEPAVARSSFIRIMSNVTDAIDLWWWDRVVNYDASGQYRAISSLGATLAGAQRRVQELITKTIEPFRSEAVAVGAAGMARRSLGAWPVWIPGLILISLLAFPKGRRWIADGMSVLARGNRRRLPATGFYEEALALLRSAGIERRYGQTPLEFVQSLGAAPVSAPLLSLTRIYNEIRFGPPENPVQTDEIRGLLKELRRRLDDACDRADHST